MLIELGIIQTIETAIKKQIKQLQEKPLLFERTDKTPNKVTNFRDFQLGEFLGALKIQHILYVEKKLGRRLTDEEFDELDIIMSRYQDDITDIYYNH